MSKRGKSSGKGRKKSDEHRAKLRISALGRKQSLATCAKKSLAFSGERNPFFGKHHSPETIEKLREKARMRKLSEEQKKKIQIRMLGNQYGKGKNLGNQNAKRKRLPDAANLDDKNICDAT